MPILAHLGTNVRDVVEDSADAIHQVSHKRDSVVLKQKSGRDDIVYPATGQLVLGEVQVPERPVVSALMGGFNFESDGTCRPLISPQTSELNMFPTLFELERVAKDSVVITGLTCLLSDGGLEYRPGDAYWQEQSGKLSGFIELYSRAVKDSKLGRPVLEGFFEYMKEGNARCIANAAGTYEYQRQRAYLIRIVSQNTFLDVFGRWYSELCGKRGIPLFR